MFSVIYLDHYTALGINEEATPAEIQVAFNQALKRFTERHRGAVVASILGRSMERLQLAHAELIDPEHRQKYDSYLSKCRMPVPLFPMW